MPEINLYDMKFIRLNSNDPYYNLAVEEYMFRNSDTDLLMLWRNCPTVVVGKNQNIFTESRIDYAIANGVRLARRITGGGAVYHDLGNINYSYISVSNENHGIDFAPFVSPIINFFAELGAECTLSGRNDLELLNKKISGSAQYSDKGRVLHHGTLLYDSDLSVIPSVLNYNREKYEYKAVRSHTGRVGNIRELLGLDYSVDEFFDLLEHYLISNMELQVDCIEDNEEIETLMARNSSDEWIFSRKRYLTDYTLKRSKRFDAGVVSVDISLSGNIIEDIVITGDFFELKPVSELEKKLVGLNINRLPFIGVDEYIREMTDLEFLELLN